MLPKLIHFIFGMKPQQGRGEWGLHHYLAVRSAAQHHPGHKIVLWYGHAPKGNPYWDAALKLCEAMRVEPPTEIHGHKLNHHAHRTDVLRLQILDVHGGIYLDADTLVLRPFDDLFVAEAAMGQDVNPFTRLPEGLCNAVILARPRASFIRRWLDSFEFFHSDGMDNAYAFYACRMPLILARQRGDDITQLSHQLFFRYSWNDVGVRQIFNEVNPLDGCYSIHLWEHMAREPIAALTANRILREDSTYNLAARPLVAGFEPALMLADLKPA